VVGLPAGAKKGNFLFATTSRPALRPTEPPLQRVPGVKKLEREADQSPPTYSGVKDAWSYISTPPYVLMAWYLIKPRVNISLCII
jgi:hypothetical protein